MYDINEGLEKTKILTWLRCYSEEAALNIARGLSGDPIMVTILTNCISSFRKGKMVLIRTMVSLKDMTQYYSVKEVLVKLWPDRIVFFQSQSRSWTLIVRKSQRLKMHVCHYWKISWHTGCETDTDLSYISWELAMCMFRKVETGRRVWYNLLKIMKQYRGGSPRTISRTCLGSCKLCGTRPCALPRIKNFSGTACNACAKRC